MSRQRILVIDDDFQIAKLLNASLTEEGFDVTLTHTGQEGLNTFSALHYDLVVLDLMLPDKFGIDVYKAMLTIKDVPVIILSGNQDTQTKIDGFRLGIDDYQTKPFEIEELIMRIKAILRRSGYRSTTQPTCLGDLSLNQEYREAFIGERKISLTAKEFDLLSLLVASSDRIVSKDELVSKLWGLEGTEGKLLVYIHKLRDKLGSEYGDCIETVWGRGYTFKTFKIK